MESETPPVDIVEPESGPILEPSTAMESDNSPLNIMDTGIPVIEEDDNIEEDNSDDDDAPQISIITISSDEEEDSPIDYSAHEIEASSFFDNLPNVLNEDQLLLFDRFAKDLIRCAANGTKISDIAYMTEANCRTNPNPGDKQMNDAKIQFARSMYLQRKFIKRDSRFIEPTERCVTSKGKFNIKFLIIINFSHSYFCVI